jgi:hypothetical protein
MNPTAATLIDPQARPPRILSADAVTVSFCPNMILELHFANLRPAARRQPPIAKLPSGTCPQIHCPMGAPKSNDLLLLL